MSSCVVSMIPNTLAVIRGTHILIYVGDEVHGVAYTLHRVD